ncbi:hypothetical protein HZB01_03815 [Candidatus Woesearchaeota archaeon]|nr:hypothetical protein [Candidatus Woesearchaeota archaeon]
MGDPIKERLMNRTTAKRQERIEQPKKAVVVQPPLGIAVPAHKLPQLLLPALYEWKPTVDEQMQEVSATLPGETICPTTQELDAIIEDVHHCQHEFDKLLRVEEARLYRAWAGTIDFVKGMIGRKVDHPTVHALFLRQQGNIGQLNARLEGMVRFYQQEAQAIQRSLDTVLSYNEQECLSQRDVEGQMIPALVHYRVASGQLGELSRQSPEYFAQFREALKLRRALNRMQCERRMAMDGDAHHAKDIENLTLQDELVQTVLYRIVELNYQCRMYLDTLTNNERAWRTVGQLGRAVVVVRDGLSALSRFGTALNDKYMGDIRQIVAAAGKEEPLAWLASTNTHLRVLSGEVHALTYQSGLPYGLQK